MHIAHKDTGAPLCNYRPGWAKAERLVSEGHALVDESPPSPATDYCWDGAAWVLTEDAKARVLAKARAHAYPPIGDQLDALWKHLNYRRTQGDELIQEADNILGRILQVKKDHPKSGGVE